MKKMGLKYLAGTAMVITAVSAVSLLTGCQAGVYGPPPDVSAETSSAELNPTVYGPPEDMTEETSRSSAGNMYRSVSEDVEIIDIDDPPAPLYGPPVFY